jgi:hypothetical protein
MKWKRCFVIALMPGMLLVFSFASAAQIYSDPQNRFRVEVPPGWTVTPLNADSVSFVHGSSYLTILIYHGSSDLAGLIASLAGQIGRQWRELTETGRSGAVLAGLNGVSVTYSGINPKGMEAYLTLSGVASGDHTFVLVQSAPKAELALVKGAFDQMQRSFTTGRIEAAEVPAKSTLSEKATLAVPLAPTRSANGDFTVYLPAEWSINSSSQGDVLTMVPSGKTQPSIIVVIVSVSDLRYQTRIAGCSRGFNPFGNILMQCVIPSVQMQLQDSSRSWSPGESLQLVIERLQQSHWQGLSFGHPDLIPISASQAFYQVLSSGPMGPLDHWGTITVYHLPNPMLGPGKVTSLALIAGCSVPASQAESWRDLCAGVIHSVRPAPGWGSRFTTALIGIYAQEADILIKMGQAIVKGFKVQQQMIDSAGRAVQRMQLEAFERRQEAMVHDTRHWVAALAGEELVRDPETGKIYPVPYGYQTYCIDDNPLDPTILLGNDISPGTWVGNHVCKRRLPVEN